MFAYILRMNAPASDQIDAFFDRFKQTPGLLHAYSLQGVEDANDGVAVAIWENRAAAEAYLQKSSLRQEVDRTVPGVKRTLYEVRDSK